jgi:hypothetical protein
VTEKRRRGVATKALELAMAPSLVVALQPSPLRLQLPQRTESARARAYVSEGACEKVCVVACVDVCAVRALHGLVHPSLSLSLSPAGEDYLSDEQLAQQEEEVEPLGPPMARAEVEANSEVTIRTSVRGKLPRSDCAPMSLPCRVSYRRWSRVLG